MWESLGCGGEKQSLQVYLFCVVFLSLTLADMQPVSFPHTTAHFESSSESTGYSGNCCASDAIHDVSHNKPISSPDAAAVQGSLNSICKTACCCPKNERPGCSAKKKEMQKEGWWS